MAYQIEEIVVYYGEDIISSRKAFLDCLQGLSEKNFEVVRVDGKQLSEELLENFTIPSSLFGQPKVLAIENLFSHLKQKDKIIEKTTKLFCPVVVWESKDVSQTDQKKAGKNFVFKNFKLPSNLFKFLDQLSPGKKTLNLNNFQEAASVCDENFLFLMLQRQVRLLILAQEKGFSSSLASWQKSKLQKQTKLFEADKLIALYKKLLKIDFEQKTSSSPFSLKNSLELLLTEI